MTFKTIHDKILSTWWHQFDRLFAIHGKVDPKLPPEKHHQLFQQLMIPLQVPTAFIFPLVYLSLFVKIVGQWMTLVNKKCIFTPAIAHQQATGDVSLIRFILNNTMYNIKLVDKEIVVVKY